MYSINTSPVISAEKIIVDLNGSTKKNALSNGAYNFFVIESKTSVLIKRLILILPGIRLRLSTVSVSFVISITSFLSLLVCENNSSVAEIRIKQTDILNLAKIPCLFMVKLAL